MPDGIRYQALAILFDIARDEANSVSERIGAAELILIDQREEDEEHIKLPAEADD